MIKQILDYYPKYLKAHQNIWNRRCHFLGQTLTIIWIIWSIYNSYYPALLIAPFIIYIPAWFGHFYFEKNKPATFHVHPLITKICDLIMCYHMIIGKIKL